MAERILGEEGTRRRRRFRFLLLPLVIAALLALLLAGSARAVHDLQFQLDGEVSATGYSVPSAATQVFDWGQNTAGGSAGGNDTAHSLFTVTTGATTQTVANNPTTVGLGKPFAAASFNRDFRSGASCTLDSALSSSSTTPCTNDSSTYATGSKDTLGIGNGGWQCNTDNNVNSKIDIANAYTASYFTGANGTGDHVIYFGLEKNKNNGTNDVGFWLLQGTASCSSAGATNFTGQHQNKDVLIVSEFTQGGGVSTIKAFQWAAAATGQFAGDGGCIDSNGNPNPGTGGCNNLPIGSGADCKTTSSVGAHPVDSLCATTNANCTTAGLPCSKPWNQTLFTPWLTWDATLGVGNRVVSPDFFEGAIDVTKVFSQGTGGAAPSCFNTIVPDTRSSASPTATLFDFVTNQLGECHSDTTTTPVDAANHANPPASSIPAEPAAAQVDVQDKAVIGVSGVSAFTATISWHICGRTDPASAQLCDGTAGNVGVDLGTTNVTAGGTYFSPAAHITAAGRYCFRAEFSGDANAGVPSSKDNSATECFTVAPRTPTLTTSATVAVQSGTAIDDTATLGNTAKQPGTGGPANASPAGSINPTTLGGLAQGTITFTLYSTTQALHCGTAIATRVVNVNGNGNYTASSATAANSTGSLSPGPGTYYWIAVYSGDLPNTTAKSGACDDAGEVSTVVDARISIAPNGVNEVNGPHTFTVTVTKNDGGGYVAAAGASVTVTLTNGLGATADPAGPFTGTTDANGQFKVTFTSATAGTVTGHASASFTFHGLVLSRQTDGLLGNSGDVVKRFVDANVTIAESAVNAVGNPHTFTITTNAFPAGTTASLTSLTVTVTPSGSNPTTCTPSGTGNTRSCTVTVNSSTPGLFTANATAVWHFADSDTGANPATIDVTRSTSGNSGPGGSGAATKRFVDAKITIGPPDATNTVGDPHAFLVTVSQDDGLTAAQGGDGVTGFAPAPNGTQPVVNLANSDGAFYTLVGTGDLCANPGTSGGTCTVTFTSATSGTVTGNAAVTLLVGGVTLNRDTDSATAGIPCGGGLSSCGPAVKHFIAGSIAWTKVDNGNRLQGGATFSLCKTANYDLTSKAFVDLQTADCSFGPVVDNTGQAGYVGADSDSTAGKFKVIGLSLGRYEVKETVAPPGFIADPDTVIVELTPNEPGPPIVNHSDQVITLAFVNMRPVLKVTGFGYTNAPEGADQPDGIFKGVTVYTVKLHNYGTAAAVLSNSSLSITSGNSNLTCDGAQDAGLTLPITGSIAVGADSPNLVLTCHYDHPNPKAITATLTVKYTTNGLERRASGSPATITYTVDPN
jgi:hypothetical protein